MGLGGHLLVLAALVVNLWLGGDVVEAWGGHALRSAFEAALILGYFAWVLRFGNPRGPHAEGTNNNEEARDVRR
ncbi:MAG: hypothetical protein K1X87_05145 [Dehalococcoidia bacterium]|nr:hypothetical protein [Dehalococcoidia bacterium]